MEKVICIVGATASGKTSLSVELAKKINGEIISADSMQIYKELSVGTAKVTQEEMQGIPHHLIDFVNIREDFSVAQYKLLCYQKIEEIIKKGKIPIIVGGTGLYVSSVINDLNFEKTEVDESFREKLYNDAKINGNEYIHKILESIDPISAKEIHPNNLKRVIRAIEICKSGITKSQKVNEDKKRVNDKYDFMIFCLKWDKEILAERIDKRVDQMIEQGLEDEAKKVMKLNSGTLRQAIGYKEFGDYFNALASTSVTPGFTVERTLEGTISLIKLRTRQYAKRQMTWFKKMRNIEYIEMDNEKSTESAMKDALKKIVGKIYEEEKTK